MISGKLPWCLFDLKMTLVILWKFELGYYLLPGLTEKVPEHI